MDPFYFWLGVLGMLGFLAGSAIGRVSKNKPVSLLIGPLTTVAVTLVAASYACAVSVHVASIGDYVRDVLSGLGGSAAWLGATISGWLALRLRERRCIAVFVSSAPPLAEFIRLVLSHP
jgi:hypothetical protein